MSNTHTGTHRLNFNGSGNGDGHGKYDGLFDSRAKPKNKPRVVKAKTDNQRAYMEAIERCDIIYCVGCAGTGKSHIAAGMAARYLREGEVSRIVGIRPAVEAGRSLGFLPGDLDDKLHPYLRPLLTELAKFINPEELRKLRSGELPIIELGALSYLRGSNFEDSFVIMDEAQNATFDEMWMFLTRLSYGSKLIINGDITKWPDGRLKQSDLPVAEQGALEHFSRLYGDFDEIATVTMTVDDICRHPLVKKMMIREDYDGQRAGRA